MIDAARPTRAEVFQQLWTWVPGVYRARDTGNRLRDFLALFADELWRLRSTIEQQYADHFIDSAQDWAVAYIADLVGTDVLYTGDAARLRETAARNRKDVLDTLRWRRRKGTLAGIEGATADISGFGVHTVDMFEHVAWNQNLVHVRPRATWTPDLRDGATLAAFATPFSTAHPFVDLRPADQRAGWHRPGNVASFEWRIESHPLRGVTPGSIGAGRFCFHPLGLASALHAGGAADASRSSVASRPGAAGADIVHDNADDLPIRTRDLREHAAAYVDSPLGFAIRVDGIPLIGTAPSGVPSTVAAADYNDLADRRGMVAPDRSAYVAGTRFEVAAVRMGALLVTTVDDDGTPVITPTTYSSGLPWHAQLVLRAAQGRLALDTVTPDFGFIAGNVPYQPDDGEFHHPVLLLRVVNQDAAAAAFPASEAIVRNAEGQNLQVCLPALAPLAPAAALYLYVADDGSTFYARGDHGPGMPDRNPDASLYGAYAAAHLARASEGQRRLRTGRPAGQARWFRVVARSLCCWDRPPAPPLNAGDVAVDPERGRILIPPGEIPDGELSVDFRYGATAAIGAGPYARPGLPAGTVTVARTRDADHGSIQDAIDATLDGQADPQVIVILDSGTYDEALAIVGRDYPGGLVIQAAALQTPFIVAPVAAAKALDVTTSVVDSLTLDGLTFAGGPLVVDGTVGAVRLRHCSLRPEDASLVVTQAARCDLVLDACISGAVTLAADAASACRMTDSAIQHPGSTVERPDGVVAIDFAAGRIALERCTVLGDLSARDASISNTLLAGELAVADPAACCMRFSRLPASYAGPAFRCTGATPVFVSIAWGDAGYLHLHPNTATALSSGAEEGGEIGATYGAGLPWRVQNAAVRMRESIPAGLAPMQASVLPRPRFRGNVPS